MSSSTTFTGALLRLQSVTPISGGSTLRVRFTQDPKQSSPSGPNDALNISNYTLTGPTAVVIASAAVVSGDPQSIYLNLASPLTTGTWTLAVANIQTPSGASLFPPTALSFDFTISAITQFNAGSFNDTAEEIIRKHLSPGFRQFEPGWNALIAALSAGDNINFENAALAFDQFYKSTASGIYLDRRAADVGIIRPESVGIGDDIFRRLAIKTTTKKVITQALLEVLEVYYGVDSTRAHLVTDIGEPYALQDADTITFVIDGDTTVVVPFETSDFTQITVATAREVAAVITRWMKTNGLDGYALDFTDSETGEKKVVVYSGSLGLESSVQVTGGSAQNALRFPETLTAGQASTSWVVSRPSPGRARYKITGVTTTDLNLVRVGDYVNIYGAGFSDENRGTFEIVAVDVRYVIGVLNQFFEVENNDVVAETVPLTTATDIVFYRPFEADINDNGSRAVIVAQVEAGRVAIQLPATTIAVVRTVKTGAYLPAIEELVPTSVIRDGAGVVTVITSTNHGFSVGSQMFLEGIAPSGTAPATVAGNGTSTTDASLVTIFSSIAAPAGNAVQFPEAVTLADGRAFVAGGRTSAPAAAADTRIFAVTGETTLAGGEKRYDYTWTAATAIPVARYAHRLSLLVDSLQAGNVLLTGGWDGTTTFSTAYLYNVVGNTWTATPAMTSTRRDHAALVVSDGRVVVAGGQNASPLATTERWTSSGATGAFVAMSSMAAARYKFGLVQLASGQVLAIGGFTAAGDTVPTASCETLDLGTGLWSAAAPMTYSRGNFAVLPLGDDQFLVAGGVGKVATAASTVADAALASAEIYDGRTGRWYPAGKFGDARSQARALLLGDQAVVAGAVSSGLYFDIESRRWAPVRVSPSRHFNSALVKVTFDDVEFAMVFGGSNDGTTPVAAPVLLVRASETIADGGLMAVSRVASVPSATSFTFETPNYTSYTANSATDAVVRPMRALPATTIPGPYIFDVDSGFAITGDESTTTVDLDAGSQYATLKLPPGEAALFPDEEGYLVFDFGGVNYGPVKYLGIHHTSAGPDDDELLLDYAERFTVTLPAGTTVTLLASKGPFVPENPETLGSFYLTDSSSGRVAASNSLDAIVASGIFLDKIIVYPGDIGLGGAGYPTHGAQKLSDIVGVYAGGTDIDAEVAIAREDT